MADALSKRSVVAIIPARFASSRFPGKPLAAIAGLPMIARVIGQVLRARTLDAVWVATDDKRIAAVADRAGARVAMTSSRYASGTDRIAAVVAGMDADIIINVQGDQPLIDPGDLDRLARRLGRPGAAPVATLATRLTNEAEWRRADVVKVVLGARDRALYFSRAPVPYRQRGGGGLPTQAFKHVGVYAFQREALLAFSGWGASILESVEGLEQLRLLERGVPIDVVRTRHESPSVDRIEDVAMVEAVIRARATEPGRAGRSRQTARKASAPFRKTAKSGRKTKRIS